MKQMQKNLLKDWKKILKKEMKIQKIKKKKMKKMKKKYILINQKCVKGAKNIMREQRKTSLKDKKLIKKRKIIEKKNYQNF